MFPEATRCLRAAGIGWTKAGLLGEARPLTAHGSSRRHFSLHRRLAARAPPPKSPREKVHIPGLEMITYADRMHFVPGLAKPERQEWKREHKDPHQYRSPPLSDMPLRKDQPCYLFHQRTNALEGVPQALWLTKTKLIDGLPPRLLSLAQDPANQIPDQDERVKNAIKHARFWDTTEPKPVRERYSKVLLQNLLHLCASLQPTHPALGRRILAEQHSLAATWKRGEDLFQIRGLNGLLYTSMDPLPVQSELQDVEGSREHVLESFYPVSPTIDLQQVNVYHHEKNSTGFREGYPFPHAHTLFFYDQKNQRSSLQPDQFRAKMVMFAFGNALARAHLQYGTEPQTMLEHPIVVQAVGTNGRYFHFLVFQLNTTNLSEDSGVKNLVWLDKDQELYEYAKVRPVIKKKQVEVPAGLAGYNPEIFQKFLSLYLNGAV
ncbi:39S ribosomal protein L37, mitochondrial [Boleophthalmus pectinirostris]|uniref:39S ribosomal protein L37, mitochondrial n=1 Tax=Boleophthalmus pectinirostris TaxID=150288 RepID=UPI000A1C3B49|nr:39S ribosomal protein L37, mitochondrial [Boleophthalmus pectinirostris]